MPWSSADMWLSRHEEKARKETLQLIRKQLMSYEKRLGELLIRKEITGHVCSRTGWISVKEMEKKLKKCRREPECRDKGKEILEVELFVTPYLDCYRESIQLTQNQL